MVPDSKLFFSGTGFSAGLGQAFTAAAASTYCLDRGGANNDILDGEDLYAMVTVTDTFGTAAGMTHGTFEFRSASATDLTTNAVTHCTKSIPIASLTAGKTFCIGAIKTPPKTLQYSGFYFTPVVGNANAGRATCWLAKTVQGNIGGQLTS